MGPEEQRINDISLGSHKKKYFFLWV
jgi:hypothetical protein